MCGICGFIDQTSSSGAFGSDPGARRDLLQRMVSRLAHRGPDGHGLHLDEHAALGHARLSIIDLEGGQQPMYSEDQQVVLVCNGEIYNFEQLRTELLQAGHEFRTRSDSEVIVHLWEEYGTDCVTRLRGMFAFALYDGRTQTFFAARDRFGQKPFFYSWAAGRLAFGSEIKPLFELPDLSRELDLVALDQYLFYQFVPNPRTMLRQVQQLPPAHTLLMRDGQIELQRYWTPEVDPAEETDGKAGTDWLEDTLAVMRDAVRSHLVSDVPVGIFLSGGIDSSLMLALAAEAYEGRLQTFSISFHGTPADEGPYARMAAEHFGAEHHEFPFDASSIEENLTAASELFDQPLADSAALPLMHLSRQASERIKVVLTGDGGDELFGGYRKYRRAASRLARTALAHRLAPEVFATSRLARQSSDRLRLVRMQSRLAMVMAPTQRAAYYRNYWEGWDRHALYNAELRDNLTGRFAAVDVGAEGGEFAGVDPVNRMLLIDQRHYLPDDLLLKTDHTTMAHGLEARAPLLDHHLAAHAGRLPIRLKATPRETKVVLRRVAERLLPAELARRPKKGFSFPIQEWFRGPLHGWVHRLLVDESEMVPQYFQSQHVRRVLDEHRRGQRNHGGRIYSLLMLELWYRRYAQ